MLPKKSKYKIIKTSNRKYLESLGVFKNIESASQTLNELIKQNKEEVRFPVRFKNHKGIKEVKYELVLLKRKTIKDINPNLFRNEYGQFVESIIKNSDDWVIEDKKEFLKEEEFYVYGYHPIYQRKNFYFIYNELLLKNINKYNIIAVMVYKNKLILLLDNDIEIIICKCVSDSIRLYTELENECLLKKQKYIFFNGVCGKKTKENIEKKIQIKTNWNLKKIRRISTRP